MSNLFLCFFSLICFLFVINISWSWVRRAQQFFQVFFQFDFLKWCLNNRFTRQKVLLYWQLRKKFTHKRNIEVTFVFLYVWTEGNEGNPSPKICEPWDVWSWGEIFNIFSFNVGQDLSSQMFLAPHKSLLKSLLGSLLSISSRKKRKKTDSSWGVASKTLIMW